MLARQGIISQDDNALIQSGLDKVKAEIEAGSSPSAKTSKTST